MRPRQRATAGSLVGLALGLCVSGSRSTAFLTSRVLTLFPSSRPLRFVAATKTMGPVQSALRVLVPYPKLREALPGPYGCVGSLVRTRLHDTCCAATISFPAEAGGKYVGARVPYWSPEAVDGLADYIRTKSTAATAVLSTLSRQFHPSPAGLRVLPPERREGWPVIVFSHGLAGCADMYTDLCRCLASFGYIVIALEHEDGSGVHAAGASGQFIRYKRPDSTPYSREKVTRFRAGFVEQRVTEMDRVLWAVHNGGADGAGGQPGEGGGVTELLRSLDSSHVSLVGHSFGAAGAFVAAARLGEKYPLKLAALLDAWAFALPDSTLESQTAGQVPLVSVLSEEWTRSQELFAVDTLLAAARGAGRLKGSYAVARSVHQSFSDTQLWLPGFITERLRMKGQGEIRGSTHALTAQTIHAHIRAENEGRQTPERLPSGSLLEYLPAAAANVTAGTAATP